MINIEDEGMMGFKDYYKILGLTSVKISQEEIKNAYRLQAKKYHPDLNTNNSAEIIKDINEAYKVLSNLEKKKKYDKLWINYIGKSKKENITYSNDLKIKSIREELKKIFFGTNFKLINVFKNFGKSKKESSKNTLTETIILTITIEEAYNGTEKIIKYNNKEYNIKIPKNSKQRDLVIIKNLKNKEDENTSKTLILELNIAPINNLKLNGLDIIDVLELSPEEAVLGTNIEYKFMNETLSIKIPKCCQNGKKIVIKNKGLKTKDRKGNLILEVVIKIPNKITEKQKNIYKELMDLKNEKI